MVSEASRVSRDSPYSSYSFWLESCGDDLTPRAALEQSTEVDVAIVGAGFTGLWTAWYLLSKHPSLRVAIVEQHIAGYGASGRNGGWCTPEFPVTPAAAIEKFGRQTARDLQHAMFDAVNEVERVIRAEDLDVHWARGGALTVALGDYARPSLQESMATYAALGVDQHYQLLEADEVSQRIRINGARGGLLDKQSAVLHPGRLVRQLARRVERVGATIYEQTTVLDVQPAAHGRAARLVTTNGDVVATEAIVLAGEAYLSRLRQTHRRVLPVYSLIALTEPLSDERWAAIGWDGRETVSSTRLSVDYLQRTADGRILFGGRGAPYHFASRIKDAYDHHAPTHDWLKRMSTQWFPQLTDVRFSHVWGGPLGVTRDWTPNFVFDPVSRIAAAYGYVGHGVSTANLAGRILTDLISAQPSAVTALPIVQHVSPNWEPEPFRWLGARYVQAGLERVDERAEIFGQAPTGQTLAERWSRH